MERTSNPTRNVAVDAYRGFVMLLMMAEVLQLSRLADAFPSSAIIGFLAYHQTHVDWAGCSLHDLIQPSFSFLVGVALPYSVARRQAEGQSVGPLFGHALWRSVVLIALGIFLRSMHSRQTNFTFEDTLTQIGLGYPFLFLLGFRSVRTQWTALALVLTGYWLAWALYPVPGRDSTTRPSACRPTGRITTAGWRRTGTRTATSARPSTCGSSTCCPAQSPFVANGGGYLTLSFIPTLGTMILGLIAGGWLRDVGAGDPAATPDRGRRGRPGRWVACCTSPASVRSSSASGRRAGRSSAAAGASCCWRRSAGSSRRAGTASGRSRWW